MAFRSFTDSNGVQWDVFDAVFPVSPNRPGRPKMADATSQQPLMRVELCFESAREKRSLSPVPEDWERASDAELRELLAAAKPASASTAERKPR